MARKFAFIVGINEYKDADEVDSLQYASRDAAQTSLLLRELGFEKIFRCSEDNGQTSRSNLLYRLEDIKKLHLSPSDSLWFCFSGHGARRNSYDYLLPADVQPKILEKTAIRVDELIHDLKQCGAGNIVLILDACRNLIRDHSKGIGGQTQEVVKQEGIMAIFSCRPGRQSYEIPELEHGSFTYALLDALKNDCKPDRTTFSQLDQHLKKTIRDLHQKYSRPEQEPWVVSEPADRYNGIILPSGNYQSFSLSQIESGIYQALSVADFNRADHLSQQFYQAATSPEERQKAWNLTNLIMAQKLQMGGQFSLQIPPLTSKNITIPIDPAEIPPSIISIDNAPESNPPAQLSSDTTLQLAADGIRGVSQPPVAETINLHDQDNLLPTLLHEATQPATKQSDLPQPATPSKHRTSRKQAAIEPTDTEPIDPRLALATRSFSFEVVKLDSQGQEQSRETKRAKCLRENLGNNIHLEMVAISGGEFVMGSNRVGRRESPPHRVTVQPFYLGRYVITQEQWQAVAQLPTVNRELNPRPAHFQHHGKKRPVECVYWHDCIEFCDRLSQKTGRKYRLPSEAEWEYACRAGTDTLYHFGDVITGAFVNYKELNNQGSAQNYSHQTIRVDSCKFANDFGLVGMHGNVQEWCYDPWHETYEQAPTDGSAWLRDLEDRNESWRITRGGSWQSEAKYCNSFYRLRWLASTKRDKFIGFRIALSGDTESR